LVSVAVCITFILKSYRQIRANILTVLNGNIIAKQGAQLPHIALYLALFIPQNTNCRMIPVNEAAPYPIK